MKNILFLLFAFIALGVSAQNKDGYSHIYTIKQPYHSFNATSYQDTKKGIQKVVGMKFSPSEELIVITYVQSSTHVVVYKVGTWEKVGLFEVLGNGVELNLSYFDEDEKKIYLRYDRFGTDYKVLELESGKMKRSNCDKTPRGCKYEEIQQDVKEIYTSNKKHYFEVSPHDPSDVLVYIKQRRR